MKPNGLPLNTSCAAVLSTTTAICHDPRSPNQTILNLSYHSEVWPAIDSNTLLSMLAHRDTEICDHNQMRTVSSYNYFDNSKKLVMRRRYDAIFYISAHIEISMATF